MSFDALVWRTLVALLLVFLAGIGIPHVKSWQQDRKLFVMLYSVLWRLTFVAGCVMLVLWIFTQFSARHPDPVMGLQVLLLLLFAIGLRRVGRPERFTDNNAH